MQRNSNMAAGVKVPPDLDLQSKSAFQDWKFWETEFEDYLVSTGQDNAHDKVKISLLRNMMGSASSRILTTISIPEADQNNYEKLKLAIEKYVSPRVNEVFERYIFNHRQQEEGETFEHYLTELRQLVKNCNYNNCNKKDQESPENKMLRDRIVHGIRDKTVQEALLRMDNLTLEKAATHCRIFEQSKQQVHIIHNESGGSDRETVVVSEVRETLGHNKSKHRPTNSRTMGKDFNCGRCQSVHGPKACPAYGKKCAKCGLLNHFARACRVRKVQVLEKSDTCSSQESLYCDGITVTLDAVKVKNKNCDSKAQKEHPNEWRQKISIEELKMVVKLDTGAQVSVLPSRIFKKVNNQFLVRPTNVKLKTLDGVITPVGTVRLLCHTEVSEAYIDFMIVDLEVTPLLGLPGCLALNLVQRVSTVIRENAKDQFIQKNKDIFTGLGCFPQKGRIVTTPGAEPVCWPPRRVPQTLRAPLKKELNRLEEKQVIQKISEIEPNVWISNLVITEKPNGKIRLCLDPSDLNDQIIRQYHMVPHITDICEKLAGKKYFSVFDLREGFHQVKLEEDSARKCCFSSPFGVYMYLRMPYGVASAPETFQQLVEHSFSDIPNTIIYFDDLLCMGESEDIHDETVRQVVERARVSNIKFNKDKLQYKLTEVKYVGHVFSAEGMKVDPNRAQTLLNLKAPQNKKQLQKLLGMFNYVRCFLPNMATVVAPLYTLLKGGVEWQWLPSHQKAFDTLKQSVSSAPVLALFDPKKEITLQCDASQKGLGCCLLQESGSGTGKLQMVTTASRSLNESEKNYSQSEKELLAIHFATSKFHDLIYGRTIRVQTDHKPLVAVMKKKIGKIGSPRLQRLRLKLLKYSLQVYYVPGKDLHLADTMSRMYLQETDEDPEMLEIVHSVSAHLPMSEERKLVFQRETTADPTLATVITNVQQGWPHINKLSTEQQSYCKLQDDLHVEDDILFWGDKIVVPSTLKQYVLNLVHEGHCGGDKTKARARQLFYWPGMSADITEIVSRCGTCEKFRRANRREPLRPHEVPKLPYFKVGVDILEHAGRAYLILVDYYSHWLDIRPLAAKTSPQVINAMQDTFNIHGYPKELMADNMPFASFECKKYYKKYGISLSTCSPHYHRSNGLAEKAVGIGKNILKKSTSEGTDYRDLLREHNNTPITGMEVSPAQILFSRCIRTRAPITTARLQPVVQEGIYDALKIRQDKMKQSHDKTATRGEHHYQTGDRVVSKTERDKRWEQAVIVSKCKEPRSYLLLKDIGQGIVRRNTSHIRPSKTRGINVQNNALGHEETDYEKHEDVPSQTTMLSERNGRGLEPEEGSDEETEDFKGFEEGEGGTTNNQSIVLNTGVSAKEQYVTRSGRRVKVKERYEPV